MKQNNTNERLDANCLIAADSHGGPLDIGNDEIRALIARLEYCLA